MLNCCGEQYFIRIVTVAIISKGWLKLGQWFWRGRGKFVKFTDKQTDGKTTEKGDQQSSLELSAQVNTSDTDLDMLICFLKKNLLRIRGWTIFKF